MRLWPRSLAGRLAALAAVTSAVALAFAALAIGQVLDHFVMRGLDERLDTQVAILARAVRADATLDRARVVDLPGFDAADGDWAWRVDGPAGHWASAPAVPPLDPGVGPPPPPGPVDAMPHPGEGRGADGSRLHVRSLTIARAGGPVTIAAIGPRRIVDAPLREAMVPLVGSLALLGLFLAAATLVQLRLGLRPLATLRAAVAAVADGRARGVPEDQPAELVPLARELNHLIARNEAGLDHARRHVANLAHGLKTPLAALALELAPRDPDGRLAALVAQLDRQVAHHLRRARAAAPGQAGSRVAVASAAADLVAVLAQIHRDRAVAATLDIPAALSVAVEAQDLDEMLGNLLDNGWRHAAAHVRVTAAAEGAMIAIMVEDDGAGLSPAASRQALVRGKRLDEQAGGHGFGLPITEELAELYGGGLTLDRSALGGLAARLTLPAARDAVRASGAR